MANFIELNDLEDEDVKLLETLAERLRKKTRSKRSRRNTSSETAVPEDVLTATAGAWKDTVDCEELKRQIYGDRLISSRPEVRL